MLSCNRTGGCWEPLGHIRTRGKNAHNDANVSQSAIIIQATLQETAFTVSFRKLSKDFRVTPRLLRV
jgi:hypothetical protein